MGHRVSSRRRRARGRGVCLGLAALSWAACGSGDPGPVEEGPTGAAAPVRDSSEAGVRVLNGAPLARLRTYPLPDEARATLLFLEGRAATPLEGGGSAWPDMDGGRVVIFDERGRVEAVLGGAPPGGLPLTQPVSVAGTRRRLLAVDVDGRALEFRDGNAVAWREPPTPWGGSGGYGLVAAARSVFDIRIAPTAPGEPLVRTWDGARAGALGEAVVPPQAMLGPVANAGWTATTTRGEVYFASAVRAEIRRYLPDGRLRWVATWPHEGAREPYFGVEDGTLTPKFRLTQQGIAVGPDAAVYVLATTGAQGPADRLLVFDTTGVLRRAAPVDPGAAIYVGPRGHVFVLDAPEALARTDASGEGTAFPSFRLPELTGPDTVDLDAYRGAVVVVNFWASWCAPCRREMPLLAELSRRLSPDGVVIIGLNEDEDPDDGRRFVEELGGVPYPLAEGRGRLRARYGYRGLPYTVVLDPAGRVVRTFYGFGASIAPIEEAVREALAGR